MEISEITRPQRHEVQDTSIIHSFFLSLKFVANDRGASAKVQLAAPQQNVLRPGRRQGPASAQVEGPVRVCDDRVRRQGHHHQTAGREGARRPLPQHPQLRRRNASVEPSLRHSGAGH